MLEKIKKIIKPILDEERLFLYEIKYGKENNENYLTILIEKEDLSLDLDTCVNVSEKISNILDSEDLIKENYYLDISSPGIGRIIKFEELNKVINRYVDIKYINEKELSGTLLENLKEKILISIENDKKISIDKKEIKEIKLSINFKEVKNER